MDGSLAAVDPCRNFEKRELPAIILSVCGQMPTLNGYVPDAMTGVPQG
jgi:hypothetical protein